MSQAWVTFAGRCRLNHRDPSLPPTRRGSTHTVSDSILVVLRSQGAVLALVCPRKSCRPRCFAVGKFPFFSRCAGTADNGRGGVTYCRAGRRRISTCSDLPCGDFVATKEHKVASFSISRKWHHWSWQHPASDRCRFVAVPGSVGTLVTRWQIGGTTCDATEDGHCSPSLSPQWKVVLDEA
jgi:hypothetical protein